MKDITNLVSNSFTVAKDLCRAEAC